MSAILSSFARAPGQLADARALHILATSLGVTVKAFVALARADWYAFGAALAWLGLGAASATHIVYPKREA